MEVGKSSCYPLDRRMGGPQSQSGCGGEEKNFQPLLGPENLIIQPVDVLKRPLVQFFV
jgi:hypothetical protein